MSVPLSQLSLFCRTWFDEVAGERLPVTEPEIMAGLNPLIGWDEPEDQDETARKIAAIIRTGGIFVLDEQDRPAWSVTPEQIELPPLPFPRIWLEASGADRKPVPLFIRPSDSGEPDDDEWEHWLMGLLVNEVRKGERWEVLALECAIHLGADERDPIADLLDGRAMIYSETVFDIGSGAPPDSYQIDEEGDWREDDDWRVVAPILLLDLIGSELEHVPVPRVQRREFEQRNGFRFPSVYYVNLRSTGDESKPGSGDKQFHCRWIVRGHWAKHKHGTTWRSDKQSYCVWRRPHVKGPIGAPWKGRPVYLNIASNDEEKALL